MPKIDPSGMVKRDIVEGRLCRLRIAEAHPAELYPTHERCTHTRPPPTVLGQLVYEPRDCFDCELRFIILLQQMCELNQRRRDPSGQHDKRDERTNVNLVIAGHRQVDGEREDPARHDALQQMHDGLDDVSDLAFLKPQPDCLGDANIPFVALAGIERERFDGADAL